MSQAESNDPPNTAHEDPVEPSALAANYEEGPLGLLRDVEVEVTLEIGRRRMRIAEVLRLASGQTLQLSKAAGEPLDLYVNGRLLGRGEAVVLGDRYGVRITELVSNEPARRA